MARATGPPVPFICGHTESCYLWKETHNIFYDSTLLKGKSFPPTKHERPEVSYTSYPSYPTPKHHSRLQAWTIGRLSNNDGDGYENDTIKVNSPCFKLYHATSISLNSPNVGIFFRSWIRILKDCKKGKESCCLVFPSSTKREMTQFNVEVMQWRKMYKKAHEKMHMKSCSFADLNLLLFWRFPCRRCHCCSLLADHRCEQ